MVTRSGERRQGCVVIGTSLRAVRVGNKVGRASPGLWVDCGKFEGSARWLQGQESVAGVAG